MRLKNTLSKLIKVGNKSRFDSHAPPVREHPEGMQPKSIIHPTNEVMTEGHVLRRSTK